MKSILLVALGGGIGSAVRSLFGGWILHHTLSWKFPMSTFLVNFTGCLTAGLLLGLAEKRDWFSPDLRVFLFTGVLGGYTTFSAFGVETIYLLRRGELAAAGANAVIGVAACLVGLWLAFIAAERLSGRA